MAGQRMRVPGFVEVSAVCTHPDARGHGYAGMLMSSVMEKILRTTATHPFCIHSPTIMQRSACMRHLDSRIGDTFIWLC